MAENETDPRLEEVQEDIDAVRKRLPDNPGLDVPDPDLKPVFPSEDEAEAEGDEVPPAGTV